MTQPGPIPVPLRVRLPYASEDEFVERYGTNVARGGVFIATRSIKPEGTLLHFEFVLEGGARLLRGEGVVVKAQVDEGGSRAGMTVRFTRLDARSKALIDRVIARRSSADDAPEPSPDPAKAPSRRISVPELEAVRPTGSEVVLGVDLGTTNSRCAVYVDGTAQLVAIGGDERTCSIPSVVALDEKGCFLVGAQARAQLLIDPANTVTDAKQLLGRRARSPQLRDWASRLACSIVADPEGDAGVELRGHTYSLPEISSKLLAALKDAAEEKVGRAIRRAVLCVPAHFNVHQRRALFQAARLAGLEVMRIFNEPSAVALAYGYGRGLARKRVLVYDLGGGTFEASVVEITGDDLEVVATFGENLLGGQDLAARVDRTVATTRTVLEAAGLTSQSIDQVLLVGGQSLAPLVHQTLEQALGRPTRSDVDPHGAVALGAAILGHALWRQEQGKTGVALSEILSTPIGIGVQGGGMLRVLDCNTRLPAEKTLSLPVKAGTPLGVAVFQGEAGTAEDNEYLGSLQLSPERNGEASLRFQLGADGLLEVTAQGPGAREEFVLATGDASEEVRQALWANAPQPGEPDAPPRQGGLMGGIRRLFGRR